MIKLTSSIFKILILCMFGASQSYAQTTTAGILPLAKTQFFDQNGNPLSSGKVYFYEPSTTTAKTTWQDINKTTANGNPVNLDAAGRALIWGDGSYRQQVYDRNNNLQWDQTTAVSGASSSGATTVGDGLAVGSLLNWSGFITPPNYQFAYGQSVSRATYSILYSQLTISYTIGCTGGSTTFTIADTSSIALGSKVESICLLATGTVLSKTGSTVTLDLSSVVNLSTTARFFPFGNGDALTTFNIPDYRGKALVGRNNMGGVSSSNLTSTYYGTDPNGLGAGGGSQNHTLSVSELPSITSGGSNAISVTTSVADIVRSATPTQSSAVAGANLWALAAPVVAGSVISSGSNNILVVSQNTVNSPMAIVQPSSTVNIMIKVLPDTSASTSFISQLSPGVPNQLAGTNGSGVWGNISVPTGLTVASNALNFDIPGLTQKNTPNPVTDYAIIYDAAGNATKKATIGSISSAASTGVTNINGVTGGIVLGTGLSISGSTLSAGGNTNIQLGDYTILTSDCGKTVSISSGFHTFTLPASAAGFAEGCIIRIENPDAWASSPRGRALVNFPTGFSNGQNILWPTQTGSIQVISGAFKTLQRPDRAKLPGGTVNFYSNFVLGSDTPGATDCMTTGASACKSAQYTSYLLCNEFDASSVPQTLFTVNVLNGGAADTTGVHYACHGEPGSQGGAALTITCSGGATITGTNTDAVAAEVGATVALVGCILAASGTVSGSTRSADCIRSDYSATVFALANIFAVCAGSNYAADENGSIIIQSSDTIQGNASTHFRASNGGVISTDYVPVGITTSAAVNTTMLVAWSYALTGGVINVPSWSYAGPGVVTGTKALTVGTGSINTGAGTAACNNTYFPGTVNGAVASPFCN